MTQKRKAFHCFVIHDFATCRFLISHIFYISSAMKCYWYCGLCGKSFSIVFAILWFRAREQIGVNLKTNKQTDSVATNVKQIFIVLLFYKKKNWSCAKQLLLFFCRIQFCGVVEKKHNVVWHIYLANFKQKTRSK